MSSPGWRRGRFPPAGTSRIDRDVRTFPRTHRVIADVHVEAPVRCLGPEPGRRATRSEHDPGTNMIVLSLRGQGQLSHRGGIR